MGSTSAGVQGLSFGASIGSTWNDENCVLRYDAAFLASMGDFEAAKNLMCQKDSIRIAYAATGHPCRYVPPQSREIKVKAGPDPVLERY